MSDTFLIEIGNKWQPKQEEKNEEISELELLSLKPDGKQIFFSNVAWQSENFYRFGLN